MPAIKVENVTKKFKVFYDKGYSLKEKLLFHNRNRHEERSVLKGISFEVEKGEAIGLIGHNGCGKSTLLKMMTRIMYPDNGTITMEGRVSSLIELGAGFHPDMSGRENIYINAAIFGLNRNEIEARIDDIINFSELGDFIDNPVRTYSSGMYMRLAFAVAINVDADILLIDEILAVGDANYQAKCLNTLREIKGKGTTIVIVSHSSTQIEQICDRAIWINDGLIYRQGNSREVVYQYTDWVMSRETDITTVDEEPDSTDESIPSDNALTDIAPPASANPNELGDGRVKLVKYKLVSVETGKKKDNFPIGEWAKLIVEYERKDPALEEAIFGITFSRNDKTVCFATNNFIDSGKPIKLKDKGTIEMSIKLSLMQGEYFYGFGIHEDYGPIYHAVLNAGGVNIYNAKTDYGIAFLEHEWRIS